MAVVITGAAQGSPAEKLALPAGAQLLSIGGEEINDLLDYGFYAAAAHLELLFLLPDGSERRCTVDKGEYEELGLESERFLMDKEHACRNSCIFCFIDQNPHGMRPSIYFKDDDERLSFLFGSYVTLTNLSDRDVERIIKMKISPVNISVHTTDPALRCKMMGNRFAGDSLRHLYRLAEAGADLNCQIVLCRDWNDGEALQRTLRDLTALCPAVGSVAVVPVGLTGHREGLTPLRPFDKESARETLALIEPFAAECRAKWGDDVVYASDEFYLLAGEPLPGAEAYGDYRQLENGVGMCARLEDEFRAALATEEGDDTPRFAELATGLAAAPLMETLAAEARGKFPGLDCRVHAIRNDFFGGGVTVAGLLTARDILAQLAGKELPGGRLLLTEAALRREGDRFLDDMTKEEFERRLGLPLRAVSDGADLLDAMLGR